MQGRPLDLLHDFAASPGLLFRRCLLRPWGWVDHLQRTTFCAAPVIEHGRARKHEKPRLKQHRLAQRREPPTHFDRDQLHDILHRIASLDHRSHKTRDAPGIAPHQLGLRFAVLRLGARHNLPQRRIVDQRRSLPLTRPSPTGRRRRTDSICGGLSSALRAPPDISSSSNRGLRRVVDFQQRNTRRRSHSAHLHGVGTRLEHHQQHRIARSGG